MATRQPSLFVVKGILESVYNGSGYSHRARYSELARYTPELRNRKNLGEYLRLLTEELGWLKRREESASSAYNPASRGERKKWYESWYYLTPKGSAFLSLFPQATFPEGQDSSVEEGKVASSTLKRPGLYAIKSIIEKANLGYFGFSDLADISTGASNRKNLQAYLKLLCDKLGWMERKKHLWKSTSYYCVTQLGQSFLDLFEEKKEAGNVVA